MKPSTSYRLSGFTIAELMIAMSLGAMVMAALFSGAIAIQRCFVNAETFGMAKTDQARLSDYLALDLRRALTVTVGNDGSTIVTMQIPDYYDSDGKPRTPTITKYVAHYGSATKLIPVVYRKTGSTIHRQVGGGTPQMIAVNVDHFDCSVKDLGKVVTTKVTFAPPFERFPTPEARTATTLYNTTLLRNRRKDL